MILRNYLTGWEFNIEADAIYEIDNIGPYRVVKTGVMIDGERIDVQKFKVIETVPQISDLIRKEKTS